MSRKQISGNPDPTADGDRDFFCCEEGLVQARPFRVQLEGKRQHLLFFSSAQAGFACQTAVFEGVGYIWPFTCGFGSDLARL